MFHLIYIGSGCGAMTQMGFRPSCSVHLLRIDGKDRTDVLMYVSSVLALSGSKENIITNSRQVRLATGIFPVVSLLNHSCSPNTSVSFNSTVATIRAARQIRKGQEIVHCYGEPAFLSTALPCTT